MSRSLRGIDTTCYDLLLLKLPQLDTAVCQVYFHTINARKIKINRNLTTGCMSESSSLNEYLTDHPRMIGVLFMLCLLLTQAGNTAAANGTTVG